MHNLQYWQAAVIDMRRMYALYPIQEYENALDFAEHKVEFFTFVASQLTLHPLELTL